MLFKCGKMRFVLEKHKDTLPENLKVVPLSYQNADQMVGLFARCHSITRSGGGTCMELMVMDEVANTIMESDKSKDSGYKRPMRFVHSQLVKGRDAENSIPLWEKGNYYFMRDKFGAKVVTPKTLKDKIGEKKDEIANDITTKAKAPDVGQLSDHFVSITRFSTDTQRHSGDDS